MEVSLGSFLKNARKQKSLKSIDVIKKADLEISLALYSQWENNRKTPTPKDLEKICGALCLNKKIAFFLWAQSNMPTRNLRKIFDLKQHEYDFFLSQPSIASDVFYPASVTKTIQERDTDFFVRNPAAGAILMRGLAAGNLQEGAWNIDKLIDGLGITKTKGRSLIQELIKRSYLIQKNGLYRTPEGIKYIYMPESLQFEQLRKERIKFNFQRVLNNIDLDDLKNSKALRINLTNKISRSQLEKLLVGLRDLADEFVKAEEHDDQKYFQLLILVGPEHDEQ